MFFITGRRQRELDEAVKQIGKNVSGVQGDVSNLADLDGLYATIQQLLFQTYSFKRI
jgi:NAD(P)-dependent dehydrogenase (short-subunit alcohol dehydrogenase family)